MSVLVG